MTPFISVSKTIKKFTKTLTKTIKFALYIRIQLYSNNIKGYFDIMHM